MNQANVFSYFHGWLGAQPTGVQSPWCCWEGKEGQETVSWPLETYPNANDFENTSILLSCTIEIRSARPARKKNICFPIGFPNKFLVNINPCACPKAKRDCSCSWQRFGEPDQKTAKLQGLVAKWLGSWSGRDWSVSTPVLHEIISFQNKI